MAQFTQYAVAAATEALHDSNLLPLSVHDALATGVSVGSGIGAFSDIYETSNAFSQGGHRKVSPLFVPRLLINLAAGHIAMTHGLHGPNTAPSSACTTGLHALGDAFRAISHLGRTAPDIMLAGASESCIHPLALSGFARARSLSTSFNDDPTRASRPFDTRRDGFVIAEGAAILVLEELHHAIARGAHIYAEIGGYGASCDAAHMTAPSADGAGAALAMQRSLDDAGLQPQQIDYVNAHATGTALGDEAEVRACRTVFGTARPCVSSTKGATGHLLGAAGALEALFTVLAVAEGIVPPTLNLEKQGSVYDADLDGGEWDMDFVVREARRRDVKAALTNSFGFGGTNATLCVVRYEE